MQKDQRGSILGLFNAEDGRYVFVGTLVTPFPEFSLSNAQLTYDSSDQLEGDSCEFVELPIQKDQIRLKLVNGSEITGTFDVPVEEQYAGDWTLTGGGGRWTKT